MKRGQRKNKQPEAAKPPVLDAMHKAIDEVRGMATRLRPGVLDDLGLVDAIDWYIDDFEKRSRMSCVFRHFDVPKVIDR